MYFLKNMTTEWLNTYIASFIPIAAPWTGSPNALRAVLSGNNFGLSWAGVDVLSKTRVRDVVRQAGGIIELIPNLDINNPTIPFVSVRGKNYTIPDFPQLFKDIGTPKTAEVYGTVSTLLQGLHTPHVPVYCAYGFGVPTEIFYSYPTGDFNKDPIIDSSDNGDGTVPIKSLTECAKWAKNQDEPVEVKTFNLLGHSDILSDKLFLRWLLGVVTNTTSAP